MAYAVSIPLSLWVQFCIWLWPLKIKFKFFFSNTYSSHCRLIKYMVALVNVVMTQCLDLSPLAKTDLEQTLAYILKDFRFPDTFLILYK